MDDTPKQSDQLPEEGPAEQVPDDVAGAGEGAARESGQQQAEQANEGGYRDTAEQEAYRGGDETAPDRQDDADSVPDAADEEVGGG